MEAHRDAGIDGGGEPWEHGWIDWNDHARTARAVDGPVGRKRLALEGPAGFGHLTTGETETADHRGRYHAFEKGGSIP